MEHNKISPYINYDLEQFLLSEGIEIDEPTKNYLNEIKNIPSLTPEMEKQFLQNPDDKKIQKKLAESYLRFVVIIATEYTDKNKLIELIQSGNAGLMKAIKSFNNNISFAEHAENYIRREINSEIELNTNTVRIPVFIMNTIEHSADENRNITVKKISDVLQHTEFDSRQIDIIYRACKQRQINISGNISPYTDYDAEKILSAEGIEICETLKEYFTRIKQTVPFLTPEKEKQLLQDIDQPYNKKILTEGYLRFVVIIAKEYIDSSSKLINLIAAGNHGLTIAIEGFDCTENISFPVLAEWLVRQEILKNIQDKIPVFYKRKK